MTGGVLVPVGVGARGKKKDWELVEVGRRCPSRHELSHSLGAG